MKKQIIITILFLIFSKFQCIAQENNKTIDSTSFARQKSFQEHVDLLLKTKNLSFEDKKRFYYDVLDTKEKARHFAISLALMNYPKNKFYIEKYIQISEDKTKKLWFITTYLGEPHKVNDGELSIIVNKNDCKLILFTNYF
ncbi:hypothetical protein [Flavobacterium sp. XGLA_31]|uniref:hypothetical protein n=1 Tax=Flavobacterium sp. XGLA_31 TaxID=3447666 RepID=UPI003F3A1E0D